MRVTGNLFQDSLVNQMNVLLARQHRLQNQAVTGQRIQSADEDPLGLAQTLSLQSESSGVARFSANISALKDRANSAYNALLAIKKISDRAGEIAVSADGTRSPADLKAYATELDQLINQAIELLNARNGDRFLFSGTRSDSPPFATATDANGSITSVTYQGNTSVIGNEIAEGNLLTVDIPAENTTGAGIRGLVNDSRHGADFFGHLISLRDHLLSGDVATIASTDRPGLRRDEENILFQISNNGAIQTRLEAAAAIAETRTLALQQRIADVSGADLTATLVQLSQAQNSYQVALQSSASILQRQNSLMNYL